MTKEHIYKGNKIIEYPNGDFIATAIGVGEDIITQHCESLEKAQKWLDDNGYSIDGDTYHCDICGEQHQWEDIVWVSSSFGLCQDCYCKLPTHIKEKMIDENFDDEVMDYLRSKGVW